MEGGGGGGGELDPVPIVLGAEVDMRVEEERGNASGRVSSFDATSPPRRLPFFPGGVFQAITSWGSVGLEHS